MEQPLARQERTCYDHPSEGHPLYSGLLALFLGVPLALGSWWGLGAFLLLLVVVIWRLMDEERYLSDHLAGYKDYCANVTHLLIPALWLSSALEAQRSNWSARELVTLFDRATRKE